jgi:acetate kinase
MSETVLCLNSGSSSLKFAVYRVGPDEARLAYGAAERIAQPNGRFWVRTPTGDLTDRAEDLDGHATAARRIFAILKQQGLDAPNAVGHRVVHGGPDYSSAQRVDEKLLSALRRLVRLAPLHLPSEIEIIEAVAQERPSIPQAACFDTAFHRRMPETAQRLPLPRDLWADGVRRYGFHGLSYESVVSTLGDAAAGRVIIAHLGNGASLAALRDAYPIDTTMGLTPLGGVIMGTRPGDLDPGVLLYLMEAKRYDVRSLGTLLNDHSGLRGISGSTSDMKTLLETRENDPRAAEAVEMFCTSVRKHIGAFAALLGGLDALVFTGAIGERAAPVRWEICRDLGHLGIELDASRNDGNAEVLSVPSAACTVRVVPTNEELMIARQTAGAIGLC